MQRNLLRTIMAMAMMCTVVSLHGYADHSSTIGPPMDPIISKSSIVQAALECPDMISVDCDDADVYMTFAEFEAAGGGFIDLPSECMVDSFTLVEQTILNQAGCVTFFLREYYARETCGNEYTCFQPVMWNDDEAPIISNCPSDTTLLLSGSTTCQANLTLPTFTATSDCGMVTIVDDAPATYPVGATTVTVTATDQCGNSSECVFVVTVINVAELDVTCPPTISVSDVCESSEVPAYADFAAFEAAGGSATNNCDNSTMTFSISDVSDSMVGGSCPKTVNRTYTITSSAGNTGSCIQVIEIDDEVDPSFTLPPDVTLNCTASTDTIVTGAPSMVMDNCDTDPTLTFEDNSMGGMCNAESVITRTWTLTDACDNEVSMDQTITLIDTISPIASCRDTVILFLDVFGNVDIIPDTLDNGSFDECSDVSLFSPTSVYSCNQISDTLATTLVVTDECGNSSTCVTQIILRDTFPAILEAPPIDSVSCVDDAPEVFMSLGEFMNDGGVLDDGCSFAFEFGLESADTSGTCPTIIERIYLYTDFSGNSDTHLILL